jgi:hypothetical protein
VEKALLIPRIFLSSNLRKTRALLPSTKQTPFPSDGINMEDIVQALQHWATKNLIESKDEEEGENEQKEQSHETDELPEQQVNSFWDISYGVGRRGRDRGNTYVPKCCDH